MCNSCWCPSVIQNVIERPPFPSYLLAVDNSNNSMEDIVEVCVANDFTPQSKQTLCLGHVVQDSCVYIQ